VDQLRLRVDVVAQLRHEPALADAGLADERDEVARRLPQCARVHLAQHPQLVVPARERRRARRLEVDAEPAACVARAPERHRLGLSLRRDRLKRLVVDRVVSRPVRLLADDEPSGRRRRLEAHRRVDDVARDEALAEFRPRGELDDRLSSFTAARASSSSSATRSRITSPARTARSASSSRALGAPKTAITASPTNLSSVPPQRSISDFARAWYACSRSRTSSGSADSDAAVKPTRSTKSTDTTLRSSRAVGAASRGAPHARQKRARSGFSSLQCRQTRVTDES
jgi:hypothetical protein